MSIAELLAVLRRHTGRRLEVPLKDSWTVEEHAGRRRIVVNVDVAAPCENTQANNTAAPFFALCLAWWFEQATGVPTDVGVRITGNEPSESGGAWGRGGRVEAGERESRCGLTTSVSTP